MFHGPRRSEKHARLRIAGGALLLCVGVIVPWSSADPQQAAALEGRLVSEIDGGPLQGALIRMVDDEDRELDAGLSGPEGAFRLSTDASGAYRVRIERIGLEVWTSKPFELTQGEVARRTFRVPERPVELGDLDVRVESACDLEPGEAAAVERVWREVRKALERTSLGEGTARYRFTVLNRERLLDPRTLQPVRQASVERSTAVTRTPYASLRGHDLAREGYVRGEGDRPVFHAPDAEALLSVDFRTTHCLGLEGSTGSEGTRIGVTFEPVRDRALRDIEGVFWLDRAKGTLEALEYAYTGLRGKPGEDRAGGDLQFGRLPDGAWYVRRWTIRLPVYRDAELPRDLGTRGSMGSGRTLQAVYEVGGEVTEVRGPEGPLLVSTEHAALSGRVLDRIRGRPLAGAEVRIEGTDETATTDSAGRFRLSRVPAGEQRVRVDHPFLAVLGISPDPVPWEAVEGDETRLRLETPTVAEALREACGEGARALVAGRVLEEGTGTSVGGATVRAVWSETGLEGHGDVSRRPRRREATVDRAGAYRLCLPSLTTYRVTARGDGVETVTRNIRVSAERRISEEDFLLSEDESGTSSGVPRDGGR